MFDATVPGSQPLTVLPSFGSLTNATAIGHIQTNQVAAPGGLLRHEPRSGCAARRSCRTAESTRRRRSSTARSPTTTRCRSRSGAASADGLFGQVNYTLSDTKTDSGGTAQNRLEAFMDNARPELNTGRSQFHVTHVVSANAIYELPFGEGRRWVDRGGFLNQVVGGWQVASIVAWQSGSPFNFFSGRGTFNRPGRSNCASGDPVSCNTALRARCPPSEIQELLGVYKVENRIYWIDPKVIDATTGRAVGADNLTNSAGFAGQVFFNPEAGGVGNLPSLGIRRSVAVPNRPGAVEALPVPATATGSSSRARRSI